MTKRRIYLYLKNVDEESLVAFLSVYPTVSIISKQNQLIQLGIDEDEYLNLQEMREMVIQELYNDLTAFVVPKSLDFPIHEVLPLLEKLNSGIYTIDQLIPEIVFLKNSSLKTTLKNYYQDLAGLDVIDTVMGFIKENQNASKAAKRLFMHRNTLNYRLDHFIEKTEIDIKSFHGALAIYLLFRS